MRPCDNCPFLIGSPFEQSMVRERAQEIADGLRAGGMFSCHKTTRAGGGRGGSGQRWCAGALGTMQREGVAFDNQMVRICGRLGMLGDPAGWSTERLYASLEEWVSKHD